MPADSGHPDRGAGPAATRPGGADEQTLDLRSPKGATVEGLGTVPVTGARSGAGAAERQELGGRYRLEERLGHGGMGEVYRAVHLDLKKTFAVKLILSHERASDRFARRFRTEAEALGRLQHPNILAVTDFGVDEGAGVPFLVTELLAGRTLYEELVAVGPLPPEKALPILGGIAAGLDYAHRCGVVHADLKPQNVFLAVDATGSVEVKLLDFGLASLGGRAPEEVGGSVEGVWTGEGEEQPTDSLAERGFLLGTPAYMAPERLASSRAGPASDVFSFGALAYQVMTGRMPFGADLATLVDPERRRPAVPPSRVKPGVVPPELDAPLLQALAEDPARRPASAAELVAAMTDALAAAREREWRQTELPRRRRLAVVTAIVAVGLSAALAALPVARGLEEKLLDLAARFTPVGAPDPRIVIVSIDDATLARQPEQDLASLDEQVAAALGRAMELGAAGVGIDILLPPRWGASPAFGSFVLKHRERLVLAAFSTPEGAVAGPEVAEGLLTVALGSEQATALFGQVHVVEGVDGRVRRAPTVLAAADGREVPSFGLRAAEVVDGREAVSRLPRGPVWIDFAVDWSRWRRVSFADLPPLLEIDPGLVRGRFVILGMDLVGSGDYHTVPRLPGRPDRIPGVLLQALMVNTLLEGAPLRPLPVAAVACLAAALALAVALAGLGRSRPLAGPVAAAVALVLPAVVAVVALAAFRRIVPVVFPAAAVLLAAAAVLAIRRALPPCPGRRTADAVPR